MREIWPGRVHRWIIKAPHIRCPTELAYVSFLRVAKSNHMQVVTDGYNDSNAVSIHVFHINIV